MELDKEHFVSNVYLLRPFGDRLSHNLLPGGHDIGLIKFWLQVLGFEQFLNSLADVDGVVWDFCHGPKIGRSGMRRGWGFGIGD